MAASLLVLLTAFAVVLAVELPDKTLVATLVLTTRYRAWPVFVGVCVAFLVQCVIAVSFGSVLTLLPERITAGKDSVAMRRSESRRSENAISHTGERRFRLTRCGSPA